VTVGCRPRLAVSHAGGPDARRRSGRPAAARRPAPGRLARPGPPRPPRAASPATSYSTRRTYVPLFRMHHAQSVLFTRTRLHSVPCQTSHDATRPHRRSTTETVGRAGDVAYVHRVLGTVLTPNFGSHRSRAREGCHCPHPLCSSRAASPLAPISDRDRLWDWLRHSLSGLPHARRHLLGHRSAGSQSGRS
jgi:hypothetical protein